MAALPACLGEGWVWGDVFFPAEEGRLEDGVGMLEWEGAGMRETW